MPANPKCPNCGKPHDPADKRKCYIDVFQEPEVAAVAIDEYLAGPDDEEMK